MTAAQVKSAVETVRLNMVQVGWIGRVLITLFYFVFWGRGSAEYVLMAGWTSGALFGAVWVFAREWAPWDVPVYRWTVNANIPQSLSPYQTAVIAFLRALRRRISESVACVLSAVTPWMIWGISSACGFRAVGHHPIIAEQTLFGIIGGALVGLSDATMNCSLVRAKHLGEVLQSWHEIQEGNLANGEMA